MKSTEQTLGTAIGELKCIKPDSPASLDELTALSVARDCIEEMLRSCVAELRADTRTVHTWPAIAYALRSTSASATKQRYGSKLVDVTADAEEQVRAFWRVFAGQFVWDFLPTDFLHALYVHWMHTGTPEGAGPDPLPKKALTRRLKVIATASGDWFYVRSRPGSRMSAAEPLAKQVPQWSREGSGMTLYGLRRSGV